MGFPQGGSGGGGAGVSSFNTRTGAVILAGSDVTSALPSLVQVNSGTAPEIDAATALTDQFALVYDQASGLWKGKSFVQLPPGAAAGDLFEFNGTGLVRIPGDTAGKVLTSQGPEVAPNWQAPSGGGGGGTPVQTPAYDGMLAENAPHWLATLITNGQIGAFGGGGCILLKVQVPSALATVTNICMGVGVAGSGFVAGQNFMGIYDSSGHLLGETADLSTVWSTAGPVVAPIVGGPIAIAAGFVFVAILTNASTAPAFRSIGQQTTGVNDLLTPATFAVGAQNNGFTSLPATLNLAASTSDNKCWWVGLN